MSLGILTSFTVCLLGFIEKIIIESLLEALYLLLISLESTPSNKIFFIFLYSSSDKFGSSFSLFSFIPKLGLSKKL